MNTGPVTAATPAPERDTSGSPDGRTCSGPADAATPGQAAPVAVVDVNDLPVTPAAAKLYQLCSAWDRQAFLVPRLLGDQDLSAKALRDCAVGLRAAVNDLRRDGDL